MKHWKRICAAMLAALVCAVFPGTTVAEEEIALSIEGEGIAPEEIQLEDVELEPGALSEADDLALELDDGALELDTDLPADAPAPAENPLLPNDGEDIPIDEAHFPDPNFRSYVAESCDSMYPNRDGVLTAEERGRVTQIWINGRGVADLRGIEYFPALTMLDCSNNQLTSLDVSGLISLTNISCDNNPLTSLNVSACTLLTSLFCNNNRLTSLDVSGLISLTNISCDNNPLTSLNMSGCSALTGFGYANLPWLTSLDVSGCVSLNQLWCGGNQMIGALSSLNVKGCEALELLSCGSNQLTSLDVSGLTALTSLFCDNNQLTSLDVSGCTALTSLNCGDNQMTSLDASGCVSLTELYLNPNPLTSLNVSGCTALSSLQEDIFAKLISLDASGCTSLTSSTFLRNILIKTSSPLKYLNLSGCISLTELPVYDVKLVTLDVSGCTSLKKLNCGGCHLTSLNVSGCTALTSLSANMNELTSLDVSDCISLDNLFCPANQLTSLDVSRNTALTKLSCIMNQLTSLDVSRNTALTVLYCGDKLTSLDVSRNTALTELYCGMNQLTSLDVTGLRELKVLCCSGNPLKSLDLTDNPYLVEVAKRGKDTYPRYQVTRKTYKRCVLEFSDTIEITANGQTLYAPPQDPVSIKKCKIGDIADQTYTGRAIKPVPVVKDGEKTLKAGTDYKVRYSANKDIGVATVTIQGKGDYDDSVKKTFRINPAAVVLSKVTAGKKQLVVEWKKGIGGVGYKLQYSLKKDFSMKSTVTVKKNGTVKYVIKKLTPGKTYYLRIRAFKKVRGKTYVSAWSKTLSKKVK